MLYILHAILHDSLRGEGESQAQNSQKSLSLSSIIAVLLLLSCPIEQQQQASLGECSYAVACLGLVRLCSVVMLVGLVDLRAARVIDQCAPPPRTTNYRLTVRAPLEAPQAKQGTYFYL